jgi:hypothetical protein
MRIVKFMVAVVVLSVEAYSLSCCNVGDDGMLIYTEMC